MEMMKSYDTSLNKDRNNKRYKNAKLSFRCDIFTRDNYFSNDAWILICMYFASQFESFCRFKYNLFIIIELRARYNTQIE